MLMRALALLLALFALGGSGYTKELISREAIADALHRADCSLPIDAAEASIRDAGVLTGGRHLVMMTCWHGAYGFGSVLFAVKPSEPSTARLLRFRSLHDSPEISEHFSIPSPSYDGKAKTVRSLQRRSYGDCGAIGEWRWSDGEFVLERFWHKSECDGETFDSESTADRWLVYPPKR